MINHSCEDAPSLVIHKGLGQRRAVLGLSQIIGIHKFIAVQHSVSSRQGNSCWFVDESYLDCIGTDDASIYIAISSRTNKGIEPIYQILNRCRVVFNLDQADHIRVHGRQGGDNLRALASKLFGCICAAAFHVF